MLFLTADSLIEEIIIARYKMPPANENANIGPTTAVLFYIVHLRMQHLNGGNYENKTKQNKIK